MTILAILSISNYGTSAILCILVGPLAMDHPSSSMAGGLLSHLHGQAELGAERLLSEVLVENPTPGLVNIGNHYGKCA